MRNGKDERVKETAAQALLDRGWGKPRVEVVTHEEPASYITALEAVSARLNASEQSQRSRLVQAAIPSNQVGGTHSIPNAPVDDVSEFSNVLILLEGN